MVNSPSDIPQLASDTVFCNPSDIAIWFDSFLSEFNHQTLVSLPSGPESKNDCREWNHSCIENPARTILLSLNW
ncbi:hypothetical protein TB2_040459 [Malus domestica]